MLQGKELPSQEKAWRNLHRHHSVKGASLKRPPTCGSDNRTSWKRQKQGHSAKTAAGCQGMWGGGRMHGQSTEGVRAAALFSERPQWWWTRVIARLHRPTGGAPRRASPPVSCGPGGDSDVVSVGSSAATSVPSGPGRWKWGACACAGAGGVVGIPAPPAQHC